MSATLPAAHLEKEPRSNNSMVIVPTTSSGTPAQAASVSHGP